jgi:hypothetical protein
LLVTGFTQSTVVVASADKGNVNDNNDVNRIKIGITVLCMLVTLRLLRIFGKKAEKQELTVAIDFIIS